MKKLHFILILLIIAGCGPSITAEPGTPSHTVQTFLRAIYDRDVETYLNCIDSTTRSISLRGRAANPELFNKTILQQLDEMKGQWAGVTVVGERTAFGKAYVELEHGELQATFEFEMIMEPDGWKIRFTK